MRPAFKSAVDRVKYDAQAIADKHAHKHQLGCGYVWVVLGNGKKFIAASLDYADKHDVILTQVKDLVGVRRAWINLD